MSNGLTHQLPHRCFDGKIGLGRSSGQGAKGLLLIGTARQTKAGISTILRRNTDEEDCIAGLLPGQASHTADVIHPTNHADHRRGVDRLHRAVVLFGLVVERDIAAGDGGVEGAAGIGDPAAGHGQLPEPLGCFR